MLSSSIWLNAHLGSEKIYYVNWYKSGIHVVGDIVNPQGHILTLEEIKTKFGLRTNYLNYFTVRSLVNKTTAAVCISRRVPQGKKYYIEIFPLCIGHCCTILQVENSLETALSVMLFEILTLFHFQQKSKMAAESDEK